MKQDCGTCASRQKHHSLAPCATCYQGHKYTNWTPMAFIPKQDGEDFGGAEFEPPFAVPYSPPPTMRVLVDPTGKTDPVVLGPVAGRKDDTGKLDVTLFFDDLPHAIEAVTEVLQWAITKKQPVPYERGSWQHVTDFQRRYRGAHLRHQLNAAKGALENRSAISQQRDAETGLLELAHIATDALFMLENAVRAQKGFE